jgi:pyruvate formate lyase activating enzyme
MPSGKPELQPVGLVFNVQRFSIHDGPGIRTTMFLKGCPLRCWWCHNPESQSGQPELILWPNRCTGCGACLDKCGRGAISMNGGTSATDTALCQACGACTETCCSQAREVAGRTMTPSEAMAVLERDITFYDQSGGGATFSGGEPLLQPDFLVAVLELCRAAGINTALDTCGHVPWEVIDRVRVYVDLFLYDLKAVDSKVHLKLTGVPNDRVVENLRRLSELGHPIFLRVPIIPGLNDDDANINETGALAASLRNVRRVDLLPYHHTAAAKYDRVGRDYRLADLRPPTQDKMDTVAQTLRDLGLRVKIGG